MANSMTGFGRGIHESAQRRITVEIKGVNHRYLELYVRMPREYAEFEDMVRRTVSGRLSRGKVEISLTVENLCENKKVLEIDDALLGEYIGSCKKIARVHKLTLPHYDLARLLTLPEVIKVKNSEADNSSFGEEAQIAITAALDELQKMRFQEGARLAEDIAERINCIQMLVATAKSSSAEMIDEYRNRLQNKLNKLLPEGLVLDESRLLAEVVVFADKCDVTEESVRLESHAQQLMALLKEDKPIGRKLDFLLQEMNREINTIGSKANNTSVARVVVEAKTELEKMREQAQNIE